MDSGRKLYRFVYTQFPSRQMNSFGSKLHHTKLFLEPVAATGCIIRESMQPGLLERRFGYGGTE
jgi:hypothetical protein